MVWPLLLDCSVSWYLMVNALLAPGALPAVGVLVASLRSQADLALALVDFSAGFDFGRKALL